MTVSPVQALIDLSHEMRLEIDLCPTQSRFMSNSPVSWCGVPVDGRAAALAAVTPDAYGVISQVYRLNAFWYAAEQFSSPPPSRSAGAATAAVARKGLKRSAGLMCTRVAHDLCLEASASQLIGIRSPRRGLHRDPQSPARRAPSRGVRSLIGMPPATSPPGDDSSLRQPPAPASASTPTVVITTTASTNRSQLPVGSPGIATQGDRPIAPASPFGPDAGRHHGEGSPHRGGLHQVAGAEGHQHSRSPQSHGDGARSL